jgi:hypothetical protein
MAALHLAGFITLRVESGIISKILDCNQVFVPVCHGILRLARLVTLRVVTGIISKMCFAGCIVALGVIFCLGI